MAQGPLTETLARVDLPLRVGSTPLLARLTRLSAKRLELAPGLPVWAQVKAVALLA